MLLNLLCDLCDLYYLYYLCVVNKQHAAAVVYFFTIYLLYNIEGSMFLEILLAIVVVTFVIILFYIILRKQQTKSRVKQLLEISNGTFDEPAQQALQELRGDLTPEQYAIRGNIIRYNVLEGPRRIPQDRTERRQFGRMVQDYERAIRGLGTRMGGQRAIGRGGAGEMPADIILNNVMTFNDAFGPAMRDPLEEDFDILQMLVMLNGAITENAPIVRQNVIEQRVNEAVAGAENRAGAVAAALAPRFTADLQNVHDTKINSDLNEILRKISTPVDASAEIAEAKNYIRTEYEPAKRQRALDALAMMERGGTISTYRDDEAHIFALVWARCRARGNDREVMQTAVAEALADCYEGTPPTMVCANGRCSRVINSLALLDYDPSITGAMTFEAYRNLIMRETGEIFDNALKRAEESDDPAMKTVAESYNNPRAVADPAAEMEFKNGIRGAIDNMLEAYGEKFNERELNQLRQECYVYATL